MFSHIRLTIKGNKKNYISLNVNSVIITFGIQKRLKKVEHFYSINNNLLELFLFIMFKLCQTA